MTSDNKLQGLLKNIISWIYPYQGHQENISVLFRVIFTVVLLFNVLSIIVFFDSFTSLDSRLSVSNYLSPLYLRMIIVSVVASIGALKILRLSKGGWFILVVVFVYGVVRSISENLIQNFNEFQAGLIFPVINLLLLIYLVFGLPTKLLKIEKNRVWIPFLIGAGVYCLERGVLIIS